MQILNTMGWFFFSVESLNSIVHFCNKWQGSRAASGQIFQWGGKFTAGGKTCFTNLNPLSIRPHQNVVWYNNSWLGFLKNSELCTKRKKKKILQKVSSHLSVLHVNVVMAHRNYFRRNNLQILKLATYTNIEDHYSRCKLAIFLDWKRLPNVHILFCLPKTSSLTDL